VDWISFSFTFSFKAYQHQQRELEVILKDFHQIPSQIVGVYNCLWLTIKFIKKDWLKVSLGGMLRPVFALALSRACERSVSGRFPAHRLSLFFRAVERLIFLIALIARLIILIAR